MSEEEGEWGRKKSVQGVDMWVLMLICVFSSHLIYIYKTGVTWMKR